MESLKPMGSIHASPSHEACLLPVDVMKPGPFFVIVLYVSKYMLSVINYERFLQREKGRSIICFICVDYSQKVIFFMQVFESSGSF